MAACSGTSSLMMGCDSQVRVANSDPRLSCSHESEVGICVWGRQPMVQRRLELQLHSGGSGSITTSSSASTEAAVFIIQYTVQHCYSICFRCACRCPLSRSWLMAHVLVHSAESLRNTVLVRRDVCCASMRAYHRCNAGSMGVLLGLDINIKPILTVTYK